MALHYCKKCGRIADLYDWETDMECDCCGYMFKPVPKNLLEENLDCCFLNDETKQQFIEEYIKKSPELDKYLFEHRDEILSKKHAEFNAKLAYGKAVMEGRDKGNPYGVECPYCHATNIKKISFTSKAVHTAVFGIFSVGRNSKQWHCTKCGSDF